MIHLNITQQENPSDTQRDPKRRFSNITDQNAPGKHFVSETLAHGPTALVTDGPPVEFVHVK